jgi:hypothetical protein
MSERCKHVEKNGFNCGSYAFNLYKDGIDQGNLCDVHYWQAKALAQPEQEPVAWINEHGHIDCGLDAILDPTGWTPLYTHPPQRTWVGLTDEQITQVIKSMPRGIKGWMSDWDLYEFSKAIEAKLKENT